MYCRKCGRQLPDTAKFCDRCGAEVLPVPKTGSSQQPLNPEPQAYTAPTASYNNADMSYGAPTTPYSNAGMSYGAPTTPYSNAGMSYGTTANAYGTAALNTAGSEMSKVAGLKWVLLGVCVLAGVLSLLSGYWLTVVTICACVLLGLYCVREEPYDYIGYLWPIVIYISRYAVIDIRNLLNGGMHYQISAYIWRIALIAFLVFYIVLINSRQEVRDTLRYVLIGCAILILLLCAWDVITGRNWRSLFYNMGNALFFVVYILMIFMKKAPAGHQMLYDAKFNTPVPPQPYAQPSQQPYIQLTPQAYDQPAAQPYAQPSQHPYTQPYAQPAHATVRQSAAPAPQPAPAAPALQPAAAPALQPAAASAPQPAHAAPAPQPAAAPAPQPAAAPAHQPAPTGALIAEFDCNSRGDKVRFYDDSIEFDGERIFFANIDTVHEIATTTKTRVGVVMGSHFNGEFNFVLKNGEKRRFRVSGTSVYGMGGTKGAKELYRPIAQTFYKVVVKAMAKERIAMIRAGQTLTVGGVEISPQCAVVKKALKSEPLYLDKSEYGSAEFRKYDVLINKKNGEKWTTIYYRIPNALLLPYVLDGVFRS